MVIKRMSLINFQIGLTTGSERRRDLIQIQWFVAIACSYLLLVREDKLAQDSLTLLLLAAPLMSMLVFLRLSERIFAHPLFPQVMAGVDTALICLAVIMNRQSPWDLILVFFFGVLIAAIGENFLQIIGGCLVVGIFSVVIVPISTGSEFSLDSNTLLRIPLLLGSSLVYGYLGDQVKREKRKVVALEENRRQQLLTKDQFFSNVSHELRTPLTAVYQFVTIVLDGLAGELKPEQKEYLGVALRNVKQLQAMVGDLLEATRAENGKLTMHPSGVSLSLSVTETLGTFSANARHKGVELSESLPRDLPLLYVDPRRLKQILTNLVDNALKFTPKGGKITVSAEVFEEDREFIKMSVADTGCGISAADAAKIFDRLYQVENTFESNRKGLGLGLHITKELVVRQGGRIWLKSEEDKGTQFYFILPAFSLNRVLQSLLNKDGQPAKHLSLIAVELLSHPATPLDVAKAVQETSWLALNQMELPQRAALVPNIVLDGKRGLFHLLQAKDLESGKELAVRVSKEISCGKQFRAANCRVRTAVSAIELPTTVDAADVARLGAQINAQITRAVSHAEDSVDDSQMPDGAGSRKYKIVA
jgi:signal transduction histidine kinase